MQLHIYVDGSGGRQDTDHDVCPTWSLFWQRSLSTNEIIGTLGGRVIFDDAHCHHVGAEYDIATLSLAAEVSAQIWALMWLAQCGLEAERGACIYFDNQVAGGVASELYNVKVQVRACDVLANLALT
eukprot:1764425-Karenia_brevis.AAC.1